jgi:hypothetical protein
MAIRSDLLTVLTANLSSTNVAVSTQVPYVSGDIPLYVKNMKKLYIDEEQQDITELFNSLDNNDVYQTETTVNAYVCVDAKTQPTDIDTVVSTCLNAKNSIANTIIRESSVENEYQDDKIIYTFEYRFITV